MSGVVGVHVDVANDISSHQFVFDADESWSDAFDELGGAFQFHCLREERPKMKAAGAAAVGLGAGAPMSMLAMSVHTNKLFDATDQRDGIRHSLSAFTDHHGSDGVPVAIDGDGDADADGDDDVAHAQKWIASTSPALNDVPSMLAYHASLPPPEVCVEVKIALQKRKDGLKLNLAEARQAHERRGFRSGFFDRVAQRAKTTREFASSPEAVHILRCAVHALAMFDQGLQKSSHCLRLLGAAFSASEAELQRLIDPFCSGATEAQVAECRGRLLARLEASNAAEQRGHSNYAVDAFASRTEFDAFHSRYVAYLAYARNECEAVVRRDGSNTATAAAELRATASEPVACSCLAALFSSAPPVSEAAVASPAATSHSSSAFDQSVKLQSEFDAVHGGDVDYHAVLTDLHLILFAETHSHCDLASVGVQENDGRQFDDRVGNNSTLRLDSENCVTADFILHQVCRAFGVSLAYYRLQHLSVLWAFKQVSIDYLHAIRQLVSAVAAPIHQTDSSIAHFPLSKVQDEFFEELLVALNTWSESLIEHYHQVHQFECAPDADDQDAFSQCLSLYQQSHDLLGARFHVGTSSVPFEERLTSLLKNSVEMRLRSLINTTKTAIDAKQQLARESCAAASSSSPTLAFSNSANQSPSNEALGFVFVNCEHAFVTFDEISADLEEDGGRFAPVFRRVVNLDLLAISSQVYFADVWSCATLLLRTIAGGDGGDADGGARDRGIKLALDPFLWRLHDRMVSFAHEVEDCLKLHDLQGGLASLFEPFVCQWLIQKESDLIGAYVPNAVAADQKRGWRVENDDASSCSYSVNGVLSLLELISQSFKRLPRTPQCNARFVKLCCSAGSEYMRSMIRAFESNMTRLFRLGEAAKFPFAVRQEVNEFGKKVFAIFWTAADFVPMNNCRAMQFRLPSWLRAQHFDAHFGIDSSATLKRQVSHLSRATEASEALDAECDGELAVQTLVAQLQQHRGSVASVSGIAMPALLVPVATKAVDLNRAFVKTTAEEFVRNANALVNGALLLLSQHMFSFVLQRLDVTIKQNSPIQLEDAPIQLEAEVQTSFGLAMKYLNTLILDPKGSTGVPLCRLLCAPLFELFVCEFFVGFVENVEAKLLPESAAMALTSKQYERVTVLLDMVQTVFFSDYGLQQALILQLPIMSRVESIISVLGASTANLIHSFNTLPSALVGDSVSHDIRKGTPPFVCRSHVYNVLVARKKAGDDQAAAFVRSKKGFFGSFFD